MTILYTVNLYKFKTDTNKKTHNINEKKQGFCLASYSFSLESVFTYRAFRLKQ